MRYNKLTKQEKVEIFDTALRFCQISASEETCGLIIDIADKFREMGDKLDIRAMSRIRPQPVGDITAIKNKNLRQIWMKAFKYKRTKS